MTGADLKLMFQTITDDDMDDIQFLIFLNAAKNTIESFRDWNFNRGFDNSKIVGSNTNYLTQIALPSDFLSPRKLYYHGDRSPLQMIGFEDRERYQDTYKRWYIDWLNSVFSICGASAAAGKIIDMFYARQTPDLTLASSPVWPTAFHSLLGYKVAEMWASGSDSDDLNFRMSRENLRLEQEILRSMIMWDAKIKTMEYNDKNMQNIDPSSYPNVVGGDNLF